MKDLLKKAGLVLVEKADWDPTVPSSPRARDLPLFELDELAAEDPAYGEVVCRCERVTEAEIVAAIRRGHTTLDGIKYFTRAQMGRCQGGFCTYKILKILMRETGMGWDRDEQAGPRLGAAPGRAMKELSFDAVVIGGGAAGMAAALELEAKGHSVALVEREERLGGILTQCIHNGFGLIEFNEELTGPEFAERFEEKLSERAIVSVFCGCTVLELASEGGEKVVSCISARDGALRLRARAVVLAMGCRERNRGNVRIPGSRPAGVFTAGLAQRLVNVEGYVPGKDIVIIGSGDIGLIMARRMSWIGCKVHAVVEILPYPSGLTRNIVQCLHDFGIPLYLSHLTTEIFGADRVEGVEVAPIENGALVMEKAFKIPCDTVLLSVGLVPENELSRNAGVAINPMTNGAWTDSTLMTGVPGIFACGNVLHVHDLVDYVVEEARRAGRFAALWLDGVRPGTEARVKAGPNVRYVAPARVEIGRENKLYLRTMIVKNDALLEVKQGSRVLLSSKKNHVQPSEMITLSLGKAELATVAEQPDAALEVSIQ